VLLELKQMGPKLMKKKALDLLDFGTTRVVGCQPNALAAFTLVLIFRD
jgi:hypothetical protein